MIRPREKCDLSGVFSTQSRKDEPDPFTVCVECSPVTNKAVSVPYSFFKVVTYVVRKKQAAMRQWSSGTGEQAKIKVCIAKQQQKQKATWLRVCQLGFSLGCRCMKKPVNLVPAVAKQILQMMSHQLQISSTSPYDPMPSSSWSLKQRNLLIQSQVSYSSFLKDGAR